MHTVLVGLNHETAPVVLREKLAFQPKRTGIALAQLTQATHQLESEIVESVILSTCNRVEIYGLVENIEIGIAKIQSFLSDFHRVPLDEFQSYLYCVSDLGVVEHLFSVVSSIDSMVIGETQIQSQVKQAFEVAQKHKTVGPFLSALFRNALTVGKRVRNETAISEHSLSVSYHAVRLAQKTFSDLSDLNVLMIGVGETILMAAKLLLKRGATNLTLINRSAQHTRDISKELRIKAFGFDKLEPCLKKADVVISATGAPHVILTYETVNKALSQRKNKPLLIVDIAVPRDVDSEVGKLDNVDLYNIDHLKTRIEYNKEQRCKEVNAAGDIINAEIANFLSWYQSMEVKPVITDLRQKIEEIREQELERALRRFERVLSENDAKVVNDLTQRIINKILHQPIVRLREEAIDGNGQAYTTAVRKLFSLTDSSSGQGI